MTMYRNPRATFDLEILHHCIDCGKALNYFQERYSDGICIHCGVGSGTRICNTFRATWKRRRLPWWQFWRHNRWMLRAVEDLNGCPVKLEESNRPIPYR